MRDTSRARVFGVGELLWDLLEHGKQLGGAATNFIYFTTAMGASSTLISRIGQDRLGDETIERLAELGFSTAGVSRDPAYETGKASIELDEKRNARFVIHQPSAWDFIPADQAILSHVRSADVICFGSLAQRNEVSRTSIRQLVSATPSEALRVFDINLRKPFYDREVIVESLNLANVLKINHEELEIVAEMLDLPGGELDRLRAMRDRFELRLVALTRGAAGSVLLQDQLVSVHNGVKVEQIQDTIGAGDSFTAAMVMGVLQGDDLDALHDRAARLASYVCTQSGATPPLPDWF